MDPAAVASAWGERGLHLPHFAGDQLFAALRQPGDWIGFIAVIIPMGLFNVLGSLQNIESAEAAGDRFDTRSSLAVNGISTILASLFGSCFPTTIYIGHPGWKGMGARSGYSTLNGLAITLICLSGTVGWISSVVPIDAGMAIVLWIGIIITAQAFQTTPNEHAPAVAVGLFPAIAAWGATVVQGTFIQLGNNHPEVETMQSTLAANIGAEVSSFLLHGLIVTERGYIFTCMILAAVSVSLIERRFYVASVWSLVAAFFTGIGLMHAYQLQGNAIDYLLAFSAPAEGAMAFRGYGILAGYVLFAVVFACFGAWQARQPLLESAGH
jgi:AGZA family xanthine/uracil permease-like MFS transporter